MDKKRIILLSLILILLIVVIALILTRTNLTGNVILNAESERILPSQEFIYLNREFKVILNLDVDNYNPPKSLIIEETLPEFWELNSIDFDKYNPDLNTVSWFLYNENGIQDQEIEYYIIPKTIQGQFSGRILTSKANDTIQGDNYLETNLPLEETEIDEPEPIGPEPENLQTKIIGQGMYMAGSVYPGEEYPFEASFNTAYDGNEVNGILMSFYIGEIPSEAQIYRVSWIAQTALFCENPTLDGTGCTQQELTQKCWPDTQISLFTMPKPWDMYSTANEMLNDLYTNSPYIGQQGKTYATSNNFCKILSCPGSISWDNSGLIEGTCGIGYGYEDKLILNSLAKEDLQEVIDSGEEFFNLGLMLKLDQGNFWFTEDTQPGFDLQLIVEYTF